VHYPNFNLALIDRTPTVLTLCDLIYYLFPQACPSWIGHQYARWMIRMAARKARRIITLSKYSKRDLVQHLGCPESKITVIYPAIDCAVFHPSQDSASVAAATRRLGIRKPYIFYTGNHEPRKNLPRLVEAGKDRARVLEVGRQELDDLFPRGGAVVTGERRPHRARLEPGEAARVISGLPLDRDAVRAVLRVAEAPPASFPPLPVDLTERELEVLRLLAGGCTKREIAAELFISHSTVHTHTVHIYAKCGVATRAGLALFAMRNGLAATSRT